VLQHFPSQWRSQEHLEMRANGGFLSEPRRPALGRTFPARDCRVARLVHCLFSRGAATDAGSGGRTFKHAVHAVIFPISHKYKLQRPNGHPLAERALEWNIVCVL
jgi:hypothetical protein